MSASYIMGGETNLEWDLTELDAFASELRSTGQQDASQDLEVLEDPSMAFTGTAGEKENGLLADPLNEYGIGHGIEGFDSLTQPDDDFSILASQISSSQSNFEFSRRRKPSRRRPTEESTKAHGDSPKIVPAPMQLKVETRSIRERLNSMLSPEDSMALRGELLRYTRSPCRKEWSKGEICAFEKYLIKYGTMDNPLHHIKTMLRVSCKLPYKTSLDIAIRYRKLFGTSIRLHRAAKGSKSRPSDGAEADDNKKRLRTRKGGPTRLRLFGEQNGPALSDSIRSLINHAETGLHANARILQGIRKNILALKFRANHENCRRFTENVRMLQDTLRAIHSDLPDLDITPEAFDSTLSLAPVKDQVSQEVIDKIHSLRKTA